jgi:hypothetical protein
MSDNDEFVHGIGNNSTAMPVRCFVNAPEVLVITIQSDGQVYKELNVVK